MFEISNDGYFVCAIEVLTYVQYGQTRACYSRPKDLKFQIQGRVIGCTYFYNEHLKWTHSTPELNMQGILHRVLIMDTL